MNDLVQQEVFEIEVLTWLKNAVTLAWCDFLLIKGRSVFFFKIDRDSLFIFKYRGD